VILVAPIEELGVSGKHKTSHYDSRETREMSAFTIKLALVGSGGKKVDTSAYLKCRKAKSFAPMTHTMAIVSCLSDCDSSIVIAITIASR
jgi:hypothetical protein